MKVAIKNVMMLGVVAVGPAAFLQGCGDDNKNKAEVAEQQQAQVKVPPSDGGGLGGPRSSRSASRKAKGKAQANTDSSSGATQEALQSTGSAAVVKKHQQPEVEQQEALIKEFVAANDNFSIQGIRGDLAARATETGKAQLSVPEVKQFLAELSKPPATNESAVNVDTQDVDVDKILADYVESLNEEEAAQFAAFSKGKDVSTAENVEKLFKDFEEYEQGIDVNQGLNVDDLLKKITEAKAQFAKDFDKVVDALEPEELKAFYMSLDLSQEAIDALKEAAEQGNADAAKIVDEIEAAQETAQESEDGDLNEQDEQQLSKEIQAIVDQYIKENKLTEAQQESLQYKIDYTAERKGAPLTAEEVREILEEADGESRKEGDTPDVVAIEQQQKEATAAVAGFEAAKKEVGKDFSTLSEEELADFYGDLDAELVAALRKGADAGNEKAAAYVAEIDDATEVEMSEAEVQQKLKSLAEANGKDVNSLTPEEAGQMLPKRNGAGNDVQPVGTVSPSGSSGNLDAEERREGTDDASEQLSKERRQAERDAGVAKQPKTDAAVDVEAIIAEYASKNSLNDDDVQVLRDELDALAAEQGAPLSAADVQAFLAEQANYEVDDQAETSAAAVVVDGTAKTDTAMNIGMVNGVRTWTFGAKDAKKVVLFFLGWTTTIESWSSDIPWNFQSTLTEAHPDTAFMVHQAPDGPNGKPSWFPFPNLAKLELDCAGVVDQVPVVDGILDHVRTEYKVTNREIHLMGFSQGGALAMYSAVLLGVKAVSSILGWWPRPLEQNFEMSDTPPDVLNFVTSTTDKVIRPWMAEMSIGKIRAQFGNHFHEQKVKQEHRAAAFTQETKEAIVNCLANWSEPKPALVPGAKQQMNPMDLFGALLGGDVNDSPGHGARGGDLGNLLGGLIMQTGRNHEEMAPERPLGHFEQALGGNGIMV